MKIQDIITENQQCVAEGIVNEFAPGGDDGGDDGFSEETLKMLAAQWYNGDEDPRVEKTLMAAGWEIGQDEGYPDEPGVFVVQAGDINGHSFISWPANELRQGVAESLDQPYRIKWERSMHGDYDALATLDDGTYLSIMFNKESKNNWMVEFYRNNSQQVTGEGDAQRVFATVLTAIAQFIKKKKPASLFFSAVKEDDPKGSREKLYDRLVQRYAGSLGYTIHQGRTPMGSMTYKFTRKQQGVAEGSLNEYRDRLLQYVKNLLPTWPEYILKDWLVPNKGDFSNLPDTELKNGIMEKLKLAGLSPNTKWQLVPNMQFTMDMFEPMTTKRLIGRAGGHSDMGLDVPRDKERHATQAQLAQQQGGVRKEPVILIKTVKGYELLEGWHRTIQHFAKYPDGYTGPAYVAVAQGQQGVQEGWRENLAAAGIAGALATGATTQPSYTQGVAENLADSQTILNYAKNKHHDFRMDREILDHPQWQLKSMPLTSITIADYSDSDIDLDQVDRVKQDPVRSIKKSPIIIDQTGSIIDGNHRAFAARELGMRHIPAWRPVEDLDENFADGKIKGRSRPGRVKRSGASCQGSVTDLRARAKKYGGERGRMYHWCANMKSGRKKNR